MVLDTGADLDHTAVKVKRCGRIGTRVHIGQQGRRVLHEIVVRRDGDAGRRSRRQLNVVAGVGVEDFSEGRQAVGDVVVTHEGRVDTLGRRLQQVHRRKVIPVAGRAESRIIVEPARNARRPERTTASGGGDRIGGRFATDEGVGVGDDVVKTAIDAGARAASVARQRPGAVFVRQEAVAVGIAEEAGHVAAAVIGVGAERHRSVELLAVAEARDAVLGVEGQAFKILLEDEVHDAGQGVRTVGRRCAAGHDFNALDQRSRNAVQVDGVGLVVRDEATAVHQHQGAARANAAQVDSGRTVSRVVGVGRQAGNHLRQLVQDLFDVDVAAGLNLLGADGRNRAVGDVVLAHDARAGHDDVADFAGLVRRGRLSHGGGRQTHEREARDHRRRQQTLAFEMEIQG
ncbi:hypothetical protein D3C85_872940 [compost metagenome]